MKKLEFKNYFHVDNDIDANPMILELFLDDACDYSPIMEMYASHYAGDRYDVYINDIKIYIDQNGYRVTQTIENVIK